MRSTTAQALVRFLAAQVVERDGVEMAFFGGVFGILGHGNVAGIGEALAAESPRLRFRQSRNEQAMVHAAVAYAKARRRLGAHACTTSIGPGATNLVTGAAAATVNRLPVLLLPGDTFSGRRPAPVLQQLERRAEGDVSVNDTLRPVSAYFDRIDRPQQLVPALLEAMRVLTSPSETGAVTIALPQDVQAEAFAFPAAFSERRVWHVPRTPPDAGAVARAAALIASSERPLLIVGGGIRYADATDALMALLAATGIPIVETQAGKGSVDWRHPSNVGPVGPTGGLAGNALAAEADLIICVGTRLTDFVTASHTAFQSPDVRFVGVNVVESDARKLGGEPVVGDARVALQELTAALAQRGWRIPATYADRVRRLRNEWTGVVDRLRAPSSAAGPLPQAAIIDAVNEALAAGDTVVAAAGSLPGDLLKLWRPADSDSYHVEYGYSTMGYEVAGGLGVKLARPRGQVVVLVGDGSWLMLSSEIVTSIQEGLPLTVVLVDNHGYGSIHSLSTALGGRDHFNQLHRRDEKSGDFGEIPVPIDLVANAASLGAVACRAATVAELSERIREARQSDRTTVIVVEADAEARLPSFQTWWDVPVAEASTSPTVREARTRYETERARQRWHL